MADNTITVVGNITRDPELKFLNSGQAAFDCRSPSTAAGRTARPRSGKSASRTSRSSGYGAMAENAANSLAKGTRVIVTGRLEQRSWETENGDKRSIVEINADEIAPEPEVGHRRRDADPARRGSNFQSERPSGRAHRATNEPSPATPLMRSPSNAPY